MTPSKYFGTFSSKTATEVILLNGNLKICWEKEIVTPCISTLMEFQFKSQFYYGNQNQHSLSIIL